MGPHMIAVDDMDARLQALLADWSARPFAWGQTDCCQFARAAAWALHGLAVDSPAYINARDALRALAALGGLAGLLRSAGLQPRERAAEARRGDIVTVGLPFASGESGGGELFPLGLAVVTGQAAHMPGALGLVTVPRSAWVQAWAPVQTTEGAACRKL